jgi:tubby-related protein 1
MYIGELAGLDYLVAKDAVWNDVIEEHILDFKGRVTQASVKNLQLTTVENSKSVRMQFGKVGRDRFTMDFKAPFTALQAFAVALSSLDSKLGCA